MNPALQLASVGRRYGRHWALRDCTLTVPVGKVAALVGPNGAGKTTLLQMAMGFSQPTEGSVQIFGWSPRTQPAMTLPRVGFVAQDRPLYRSLTVAEMLTLGRKLNTHWDDSLAKGRLATLGIDLARKVGRLSGGQQAQVALVMALAKRPELLLLDEPVAALDPIARREFQRLLMEATVEAGLTIVLSSHIIGDLERLCDYLVILDQGHVALSGDIDQIVAGHKILVGTRSDTSAVEHVHTVVRADHTERQTTLLIRTNGDIWDPSWLVQTPSLEDIALAYLDRSVSRGTGVRAPSETGVPV